MVENGEAGVSARVYPALIDENHPLASVHGSFNAVFVKAEAADDLMFYGRGAGGAPTASAVVGDVVTVARHIAQGCTGPAITLYIDLPKAPIEASKAAFAVRFVIHDKPGVLAAIAEEFAKRGVSINGVNQDLKPTLHEPGYSGELQQLRLVTHLTDEVTLRETVEGRLPARLRDRRALHPSRTVTRGTVAPPAASRCNDAAAGGRPADSRFTIDPGTSPPDPRKGARHESCDTSCTCPRPRHQREPGVGVRHGRSGA